MTKKPIRKILGENFEQPNPADVSDTSIFYDIRRIHNIIISVSLLLFLLVISRYNYLLFHTLAEFFSITIAWCLFIVVWNSQHLTYNKAFVFIGIAYLFVGSIDLVHAISYKGMGVILEDWGANPATQLWIAARLIESISLFLFPFLFFKDLHLTKTILIFAVVTTLIFLTIFYWKVFPDCFVEGAGLTDFKKITEYGICAVLCGSWILLYKKKAYLDETVYKLLMYSIALTIIGELAFTAYVTVYGISNLIGHYFKIISFFLIYLALVRNSLKKPYETLFRELDQSNKKFQSLFEKNISGVALHEIVLSSDGKPIDYRFVNFNFAFENLTGLKRNDIIGKTVLEVLPNTESHWFETYGQVALTGEAIQFENYTQELKKHFEVSAYCPKQGQFVTVFNDITDKKNAEAEKDRLIEELQQAVNEIKTLRGILPICSICKQIRDDKGYWNKIEAYIEEHTDVDFSHGICPKCADKYYSDMDLYGDG